MINYDFLPTYLLRTPLLPIENYLGLFKGDTVSKGLLNIFNQDLIKEAIFLASPELYHQLNKWEKGLIEDSKNIKKLQYSLLKYISRMSTRCTPFGLFAGCSVGKIGSEVNIRIDRPSLNQRYTRLDMNFLVALSQRLMNDKKIRDQILFYPNTSLYNTGKNLRFVEYYYSNGKRKHRISSVDKIKALELILNEAKNGQSINRMASVITSNEIQLDVAIDFVHSLIDNQILIGEFEPTVSGSDFLLQIIEKLSNIETSDLLLSHLREIQMELIELDKKLGNTISAYEAVEKKVDQINVPYISKFLFQTDMNVGVKSNEISHSIADRIQETIGFLTMLTPVNKSENLNKFIEAFTRRYGDKEIEISKALDIETGIGYLQNNFTGIDNPLVDDLIISSPNTDTTFSTNPILTKIDEEILRAYKNDESEIVFAENSFKNQKKSWNDLPDTFSAVAEIMTVEGKDMIKLGRVGGNTAASLIGRFCHTNKSIEKLAAKIISIEDELNKNKISAEIVHLPEDRVGNVLIRPELREFEIPYLARSCKKTQNQIFISDIMISVKRERIVLRSKKLNKEIIPYLSNAHNYATNALPIYQLLCEVSSQNKRNSLSFPLGPLSSRLKYVPRIKYKDVILREAEWFMVKSDIEPMLKYKDDIENLKVQLKQFLKQHKLPNHVVIKEADNELPIYFEDIISVEMFLDTVKSRRYFYLKELLVTEKNEIRDINNLHFANEIVLTFYKRSIS